MVRSELIKSIDISVVRKINEQKAKKIRSFPFKESRTEVYIYASNNKKAIVDEFEFIFRKNVEVVMVSEEEFEYLLKIVYLGNRKDADYEVFKEAINLKASDIHFEPYKDSILVRFRIDGLLRSMFIFENKEYIAILSKMKISSNLDITEKRKPQDGKITFRYSEKDYDLRISIIPIVYGEKAVIRILYGNVFNYSIDKLNLTHNQKKKLKYIMKVNTGLTIVNGPTGSGKSTTLYCMLQELNKDEVNISSLEDPIEAVIPGINQMNLNKTLNIGFAEGLRSLLRQDPDIVMLGEIRDEETAEMAVRAALTGHKVYSTIHTRDPREVYFRLEDMGVEKYLIRDSLVGIISQRLIRLLCNKCKSKIGEKIIDKEKREVFKRCGCMECNYTGYSGRALVAAIHVIDNKMKNDIKNIYNNTDILSNIEMIENLNDLLKNGDISIEDYENFIEMEGIDCSYEEES
ncbi:GspE/PulE family protein [Clostridium sp.]|uniref:GspE/PulE family protein n=2 Tax=unclassified Clostridium TaxID=2614128 RepID=UPI001B55B920|nr:GspE/PulE family protein [Clostridium sp.]MBP3915134.1 type II/IV secretion system protein [Clostridium sp.]MEE0932737.1 GspE/PulE family protein [Clostridium sp.]